MAKPAKIKKKQVEADPGKNGKKAAAKTAAKAKAKESKSAKPTMTKVSGKVTPKEKRSAGKFLREVRLEMSKVTWPGREELVSSTIVVVIAVAIAGVYIALFDALFSRVISWLG